MSVEKCGEWSAETTKAAEEAEKWQAKVGKVRQEIMDAMPDDLAHMLLVEGVQALVKQRERLRLELEDARASIPQEPDAALNECRGISEEWRLKALSKTAEADSLRGELEWARKRINVLQNALASISLSGNDNTAPAHVVLKGAASRARKALYGDMADGDES